MASRSFKQSLRAIILGMFPWMRIARRGPRTYVVGKGVGSTGLNADGTCNLQPPAGSMYAPLASVPQWLPGGVQISPLVGSECTVIFRDNDRRKPAIVSFTPLAGSVPSKAQIDALLVVLGVSASAINLGTAAARLVREGDLYTIGIATGPIAFVSVGGTDPLPTKVSG